MRDETFVSLSCEKQAVQFDSKRPGFGVVRAFPMAPTFPPLPPLQKPRPSITLPTHLTVITLHVLNHSSTLHSHIAAGMVVALGPGKFYGSSLPRPRFYSDVKLNDQRVDPPLPVMDPLMSWAEEAHWSMGGLNFKRHRLQGRIEGSVEKLRAQRERVFKRSPKQKKSVKDSAASRSDEDEDNRGVSKTPSPPPAPVAIKRRRVVGLLDEDEEEVVVKRGPVRKLGDDFERVARESGMAVKRGGESDGAAARTRSQSSKANVEVGEGKSNKRKKILVKGGKKNGAAVAAAVAGKRTSPRLAKNNGSS